MQFGAMEPKSVQARKLNELVKMMEELKAEIEALKSEDAPKKASKKKETE